MEVASNTKTIQSCFRECLYEVPNFQRPYSWEADQLEDYWNDVVLANSDFFFGTTVTWVTEERALFSNTYSLIDGQQRLTTSAVALSVIRDSFGGIEELLGSGESEQQLKTIVSEQKAATQKYLVVRDDDSNEHPVIRRPEPMFWEVVQKPGSIPSGATWTASAKLVGSARTFFENKVSAMLDSLEPSEKIDRLKTLRSNVLQANVIQVELSSEEDAFLIFETLNTRGADLRLADLVKNMLVRGLSNDTKDRDAVAARWQRVVDEVTGNGDTPDSINRFIWQSWNSRRDAVKEPELYKELKSSISAGKLTFQGYLDEIETDAAIFRHLEGGLETFPKKKNGVRQALALPEVQDSIRALALFNVSVANSAVIALVRKFNDTKLITEKQLKRSIRAIENFHFQFSAMANSGSTGGTRARYNRFSVTLESASSKAKVGQAINEFIERLSGSLPEKPVVTKAFTRLAYAPRLKLTSAQRARGSNDLIKYVLITIAKRLGNLASPQDNSGWTIEHIIPQVTAGASFEDPIYSIGNLALMSGPANSDLGNSTFDEKRPKLISSGFPKDNKLTDWLACEPTFQPSTIEITERAESLANLACDTIWAVT
ncbi:DUF262 domain-containing protein [Mycobacteroides abscessus]|uniref:DUF262 domain-containing protein n=1 Tax=Mycobacteroides abscessus TaxID=36809 RepID=UPI0019D06943|nr:DUF262 domain-containing protein [Mycobacteroides abscessus]MBN7437711.1 DUF262 domain-containing protein [Mycobacteroides abscessus subsp. abscessus]